MGNKVSKSNVPFGSIYPTENNPTARPGYYFNKKKLIYNGQEVELLPEEKTFTKLKYGYLKTNKRVLYKGVQTPANPETIVILNRDSIEYQNKKLKTLNSVIAMDINQNKKRFFHKGIIIHEENIKMCKI
jgi:hypothetical protein